MVVSNARRRQSVFGMWVTWLMGMACFIATTTSAYAQAPDKTYQVAVLNVIGEGVSEELAREVTRVLKQETARNPSHVLVQQEDIALLESLFLFGCESPTPDCMTQLAESLEADRLVYGRLVEVDGLYDIEINIFDRQEGREVSKWNKRFTANANVVGFFTREMEIFLGGRNPESAVVLRVSANVPNALVTIDGKQAGRTPFFTDKLAEGRHSIEVSKEGYVPWSYEGNLTPGVPLNFKASLSVVTSGPPTDDEQDPNEPPQPTVDTTVQLRTLGWTSVGLGAASLVAGGVFGILVLQSERDVEDAEFLEDAQDIEERGERFASLANIFYATGGGLVLLGVILVLVDDNADESFSAFSPTGDPGPRTIEVTPSPLEGGAGVSVEIPW